MVTIFDSATINGMQVENRFVRSATWEGLAAEDGSVTPGLTEKMVELTEGGVGLIITSYAFVSSNGQSSPRQLAVWDDRFVSGLKDMAQAVHAVGGKIALQIVHGGSFSSAGLTGTGSVGPSDVVKNGVTVCRSLTAEEISGIVSNFARAAARAKQAGFDAVQLHAAHGFLISQFLSPAFNTRTDKFGGVLENRARFLMEVVKNVRQTVGSGYPILVKLNSEDFLKGGMTRDEALQVAGMLEEATVDAIEYSGGTVASDEKLSPPRPGVLKSAESEVYYREAAKLYKQKIEIPLMLVGGIRSFEVADALIKNGICDFISMSRPFICEPALVKRWKEGDHRIAECISCNLCFGPPSEGKGFYCVTKAEKKGKEKK